MNFVEKANLPKSAKTIIIGDKYKESLKDPLENKGIEVLLLPDNPNVDRRLSGHADLSVLHLGNNKIALAEYLKGSAFAEKLKERGFEIFFSKSKQTPVYPGDAALNICICGNKLIFNPKSADNSIVDYLTKREAFGLVPVKQGYTKCSVCVVRENVIITSDIAVHKRAVADGIDALLVRPGYFELSGFDYGFIGGSSFMLDQNTLAFTGNLEMHPDKNLITEFASLHNIDIVYITQNKAFDIGSAIQIVERDSH